MDWLNEVLIWHIPGAALEAVIIILAFFNLFVPIPCATVLLVQLQISRHCRFQYCFLHFSFSKGLFVIYG